MKKQLPKIYSTGNETINGEFNISYYIMEKSSDFLDWLGQLLTDVLNIENGRNLAKFYIIEKDSEQGYEEELIAKKIDKMIDLHEHYESNLKDRIDLFYGKNRAYITFRKSRETRKKLATFIQNTKEWIKLEETNPTLTNRQIIKRKN